MPSRPNRLSAATFVATMAATLLAAACGCPPPQPSTAEAAGPPPRDTIHGLVVIVRTADQPAVLLRPIGSAEVIPVDGAVVGALRDLEGFDVWVAGTIATTRGERSLHQATAFRVLAVENQPVRDGQLVAHGDSLFIPDSTGALTRIVSPTEILRHDMDRRVWVAGPYSAPPSAFGVIHVTAAHDLRSPDVCFDPRRPRREGRPAD